MTDINDTLDVAREAPQPSTITQPYWDGTRDKKFLMQFDPKAGKFQWFPRATSMYTGRRDLEWKEVSGKGEVYSFTVARRAPPPFRGHEPFLIAVVTLDEGVNVMGNMVNCTAEDMKVGLRVKPYWSPLPDGYHQLMFEPDRG